MAEIEGGKFQIKEGTFPFSENTRCVLSLKVQMRGGGEGGGRNKGRQVSNKGGHFTPLFPFSENTRCVLFESADEVLAIYGNFLHLYMYVCIPAQVT